MASELRVNTSTNRSGLGTITYTDTGAIISGIVTATSFSGDVTGDVTGNVTGTASNASGATGDFSIADKIIHTGDTNTAIRFPAADTITAETGGSERVRITSTGLFGVGVTPSSIFHVRPLDETNFLVRNEGSTVVLASETNNGRDNNRAMALEASHFEFIEGGSEKIRIDSSGRLLGGLTSSVRNTAYLQLKGANTSDIALYWPQDAATAGSAISWLTDGGAVATETARIFCGQTTTGADGGYITFMTHNGTSVGEKVRITSDGKLGLGETTPDFKFHSKETGGSTIAGLFETNQTDAFISFQASGTTSSSTVRIGAVGDNFQAFIGSERLRITSGGQVNIGGNYTQTNNTLNVTGNIFSSTRFNLNGAVFLWQQNRMSLGNSFIIESQQNTPFAICTQGVAQPIVFGTSTSGGGAVEHMRIASGGNVGIGNRTATPSDRLHVHTGSGDAIVHIEGAANSKLKLSSHGGDSTINFGDASSSSVGNINYDHGSDTLSFKVDGSDRLSIDLNGNVTIPTTDAKLKIKDGNNYIQFIDAEKNFKFMNAWGVGEFTFHVNGSERLRIDSTGDVTFAGTNLTDNTNKNVNLRAPSFDTDEEDVNLIQVENESGMNQISFGGGTSGLNSATILRFMVASSVNTTTGTERMRIRGSDGMTLVSGLFQVNHCQIRDGGFSGSTAWDTGISVNGSNAGACMLVLVCRNWNAGTSTEAGIYQVGLAYDGNNAPGVNHIAGNSHWTISKSSSNTVQIAGSSGNHRATFIWTT